MKNLFYSVSQDIPPMVLIHGLGSNQRSWKFQIGYFSKRCRDIAGDTGWHGKLKSVAIPARSSIKQYANDWWKVIERLRRPFVMWTGMGSSIALQIVLDHPDGVRGGWSSLTLGPIVTTTFVYGFKNGSK